MTTRNPGLDLLKWLAIISMIADHLRYLWPQAEWLFVAGRLAFPWFCLALAANVVRTQAGALFTPRNGRYLGWLVLFSVLSEAPYRWLDNGSVTLNVMPTLALGLLVAWGVHHRTRPGSVLALVAVIVSTIANDSLMYGLAGVLLPGALLAAIARGGVWWMLPGLLAVAANLNNSWLLAHVLEPFVLLVLATALAAVPFGLGLLRLGTLPPIWPVGRWGYGFYPVHLALIKTLSLLA
ncbi:hypothetical protein PS910_03840 [Pseudomonas fluorescens]|nr:hypothetical protein PS910_03840 [Pseudomonas fluorescens]